MVLLSCVVWLLGGGRIGSWCSVNSSLMHLLLLCRWSWVSCECRLSSLALLTFLVSLCLVMLEKWFWNCSCVCGSSPYGGSSLCCGSTYFLYHLMLFCMCSAGVAKWFLRCGIVWLCCSSALICTGAMLNSRGRYVMMAAWILSCSGCVLASLACIAIVRCGVSC